jgi:hypothetical protein
MAVSEAELDALRARANHLRTEIRAFRTEGETSRLEADRDAQAELLKQEIERLERETIEAAQSRGGSVEDAMAAMQRAEDLQKMMTPAEEESSPQEPSSDSNLDGVDAAQAEAEAAAVPVEVATARPAVGETPEEGSK